MAAGSILEFWVFSDSPYAPGPSARNAAWMTFGGGTLVSIAGSAMALVARWRAARAR